MRAMLKDDPNWAVTAELQGREIERRIAAVEEAQRSPIFAAFAAYLAAAIRESGGRQVLDGAPPGAGLAFGPDGGPRPHVIGPEHHHSAPEWADRVCYCDEPESPRPAGAAAAEALEIAAMTGEPYVPLEGIAEGEPVRGDGAALAAMREGC